MEETKRTCLRCGTEMLENCFIAGSGGTNFLIKQDTGKLFSSEVGYASLAVCPACGEISWYLSSADRKNLNTQQK